MVRSRTIWAPPSIPNNAISRASPRTFAVSSPGERRSPKRRRSPGKARNRTGKCSTNIILATPSPHSANWNGSEGMHSAIEGRQQHYSHLTCGGSAVRTFAKGIVIAMTLAMISVTPSVVYAQSAPAVSTQPPEDTWNSIRDDIFKGRPILDGSGVVALEAPKRAEDAAIVPITMKVNLAPDDKRSAADPHARDRRKSGPCRRDVHNRTSFRRNEDFHPCSGEYLFLRPRPSRN